MNKLSITGADNNVCVQSLKQLIVQYSFLELAILYLPEKENLARNPGKIWRQDFLKNIPYKNTALHLCGKQVFEEILGANFLKSDLFTELKKYNRLQLNINARAQIFSNEDIQKIYSILIDSNFNLILQYHERSKEWILPFIRKYSGNNINILLDASLGKGITPDIFTVPDELLNTFFPIGFAGGLNPENIKKIHLSVQKLNIPNYWLDLESGVRTNNEFDMFKVTQLCDRFV